MVRVLALDFDDSSLNIAEVYVSFYHPTVV